MESDQLHKADLTETAPAALPSLSNFKSILRRAVDQGRLTWSANFQRKCLMLDNQIGFNIIDVVNVIRHGRIVKKPILDEKLKAWRCEIADSVEGHNFVVQVALDCNDDFQESPRAIVITGFWKRGRRKEVRDWSKQ